jgi:hypothetical protein
MWSSHELHRLRRLELFQTLERSQLGLIRAYTIGSSMNTPPSEGFAVRVLYSLRQGLMLPWTMLRSHMKVRRQRRIPSEREV